MKTRFNFMDPGVIMGVIVALIVLAVGVYTFFVVFGTMKANSSTTSGVYFRPPGNWSLGWPDHWSTAAYNSSYYESGQGNFSVSFASNGGTIFNILGVVMVIGAIMAIVGLVYNYVR